MNEITGQQLRTAREAQKITLEQAAHATRMRERYLRALEEGDYQSLPSSTQARGFLRAYAAFLKLDPQPLMAEFNHEQPGERTPITADSANRGKGAALSVDTVPINFEQADALFTEIGRTLQHQRELLGLSLDDVVRHTHLRIHYLQALESGSFDDLPSPVQAKGMLNNYAVFLALDPEPLLLKFAEGLQLRLIARKAAALIDEAGEDTRPRRRRPLPAPIRRLLSPDVLIGVTFAIALVIFVGWGAIRIFSMESSAEPTQTAPSIAEVLLATPTPGFTPSSVVETATSTAQQAVILPDSGEATATPEIVLPGEGAPGVQVYLTILQRAWLRATVDGKVEFEGRVTPGSAYPFVGASSVEILTSNGAAVQVFFNQQDLGLMGLIGQLVDQIYTPEGMLTPTPTITRTPTPTPRTTPTATGTAGAGGIPIP